MNNNAPIVCERNALRSFDGEPWTPEDLQQLLQLVVNELYSERIIWELLLLVFQGCLYIACQDGAEAPSKTIG